MKVLITFNLLNIYVKKIEDISADLIVQKSHKEKELLEFVKDADILFAQFFSRELFLAAKKLKWIQTLSAGVERFLLPEVVKSHVIITNASGVHSIPISEHVIGLMLCLSRKLHLFIRRQFGKKWEGFGIGSLIEQIEELSGKTVGIVGVGRIGSEIARKAKAFGMRVIATRRNLSKPKPEHVDDIIAINNLKTLLVESDFVVIAVPLTKETEGMIGEDELKSMKKTSYLINISRGKIVQEKKLIQALKEGWIAGAGLDTFEKEPLPQDSELWEMKNVIITPHVAGATPHYLERATNIFCENLKRFMRNEPLINVVDKTLGY